MRRLLELVRVLGWRRGVALRCSEIRRCIVPCWGGPFDGEWRFSAYTSVVVYVQAFSAATAPQWPLYSTSSSSHMTTIGMYVWRNDRYHWHALVPARRPGVWS